MTDEEIRILLEMPKVIERWQKDWKDTERGHLMINCDVRAANEPIRFRLFVRQNTRVKGSFSCGLIHLSEGGETTCLTRYNGSDHLHSNPLDSDRAQFRGCHIHKATQRYIAAGRKAEHFAVPTDRYTTVQGALQALLADCRIEGDTDKLKQLDIFN